MKYSLKDIRDKYYEYKEVLEKIEKGDYNTKYNVRQLETMRLIVKHLDDLGFNLLQ